MSSQIGHEIETFSEYIARMHVTAKSLLAVYQTQGHRMYDGEPVTQLEHAWQCGFLAEKSGAHQALLLASWLHDVGHLWVNAEGSPTLRGENDAHEAVAARLLMPLFGPAVAEPVRLHVAAKRYLVSTRPTYGNKLSSDSVRSLALQGGPMSEEECAKFELEPYFLDALKLRVWDDLAKNSSWLEVSREEAIEQLRTLMDSVSNRPQSQRDEK